MSAFCFIYFVIFSTLPYFPKLLIIKVLFSYSSMTAVLRIRDYHPGSWFIAISYFGSNNSNIKRGGEKICCLTFICSHKFHLNWKLFYCQVKYRLGIRGPGSGKNISRIAGSKQHLNPDSDPQHCMRNIVVQEKFLSLSRPAETEGAEEVGNIWFLVFSFLDLIQAFPLERMLPLFLSFVL